MPVVQNFLPASLNWLDYGFSLFALLSIVLGAIRGLVSVALSLAAWCFAAVVAYYSSDWLSPHLTPVHWNNTARDVLAWLTIFAASLIAWQLFSFGIKKTVVGIGLGPLDHLLGAVFGFIRAVVIILLVMAAIQRTPLAQTTIWQASLAVAVCQKWLVLIQPYLPTGLFHLTTKASSATRLTGLI